MVLEELTSHFVELISRGKVIYEAALKDPESLADVEPPVMGLEGWQDVARLAYESKTGKELPYTGEQHPAEPAGDRQFDEDELGAMFPRLTEKFD